MIYTGMFDELALPGLNVIHLSESIKLGTRKRKEKMKLATTVHPTQTFKEPR